jgi:hypothetical protein
MSVADGDIKDGQVRTYQRRRLVRINDRDFREQFSRVDPQIVWTEYYGLIIHRLESG